MNNNSEEQREPLSNKDLEKICKYLQPKIKKWFYTLDELDRTTLKQIFKGSRYFTFIFIENPNTEIGHWTLLSKIDDNIYEYFDSGSDNAKNDPDSINQLFMKEYENNKKLKVIHSGVKLQNNTSDNCGRFCVLRAMTLNHPLQDLIDFFEDSKMTPDQIVELLVNIPQ